MRKIILLNFSFLILIQANAQSVHHFISFSLNFLFSAKSIVSSDAADIANNNLIFNGDFSLGNTGFKSDYYSSSYNTGEGEYFISSNPLLWNPGSAPCTDHTSGKGNMMLVNGAGKKGEIIWKQTVNVKINTNYDFTYWVQSIYFASPAKLQLLINGISVGEIFSTGSVTCKWKEFNAKWSSVNNTKAIISLIDLNTQLGGNDFALDDISLIPVSISENKESSPMNPNPSADFTYFITNCNKVQFKITSNENIKSYRWDLGDKSTATKESFFHTYKNEGSYRVKLIAAGTNGKEITVEKTFTVVKPTTAFTYESETEKNTFSFNITNKQKLQYKWFFGDGAISDKEKKIIHTYKQPGSYEVMLIAKNKNGCSDTAQQTIVIATPALSAPENIVTINTDTGKQTNTTALLPEKRENNLLKEIAVTGDSVAVTFYDNAEIDGDSVTIVYNNKVMATHLFLTDKPKTFMLPVNKNGGSNELIMYAENLGSIPPNTALMIVYDAGKRYEISISSSKTSNGMVRFIFKP
ncbi:PKD domain-containing protein [Ferruginibacter sp.]